MGLSILQTPVSASSRERHELTQLMPTGIPWLLARLTSPSRHGQPGSSMQLGYPNN
jgi:hypothetical protein